MMKASEAREITNLKDDAIKLQNLIVSRAKDGYDWAELPKSSAHLRDLLRENGYGVEPVVDSGHVYGHKVSW